MMPGTLLGVTVSEVSLAGPSPAEFTAATRKEYFFPGVSPSSVQVVASQVLEKPLLPSTR
jgi:hypothetical protein